MKQSKTLIKELRQELHYHQTMVRVDLKSARAGIHKCRELGAKMRALQNGQAVEQTRAADLLNCPQCGEELHNGYCSNCKAAFEIASG